MHNSILKVLNPILVNSRNAMFLMQSVRCRKYYNGSYNSICVNVKFNELTKLKKTNIFGLIELIMYIMNSSLCTKKLNLKTHHMALIYKLNVLSFSTNHSNARALRCNSGSCCNVYSLYNG